jgi:benzoylformate decarboxylase
MVAAHALVDSLPPESIVVDEAITTGAYLRGLHGSFGAHTYWFCRGGGLGWGMPAATGISLGAHREPVLAVIGDGSAMYAPQALWTAARERLPVVFAVVDNGEYAILKRGLEASGIRQHVGLDLGDPSLDFVALAASMGVPASRAESVDDIRSTIARRWGSDGPYLLHVPLAAAR